MIVLLYKILLCNIEHVGLSLFVKNKTVVLQFYSSAVILKTSVFLKTEVMSADLQRCRKHRQTVTQLLYSTVTPQYRYFLNSYTVALSHRNNVKDFSTLKYAVGEVIPITTTLPLIRHLLMGK